MDTIPSLRNPDPAAFERWKELITTFGNWDANHGDNGWKITGTNFPFWLAFRKYIEGYLARTSCVRMLDVGPCQGLYLNSLQQEFQERLEIHAVALTPLHQDVDKRVITHLSPIEEFPLSTLGEFEIITALNSVRIYELIPEVIAKLMLALKVGGVLLVDFTLGGWHITGDSYQTNDAHFAVHIGYPITILNQIKELLGEEASQFMPGRLYGGRNICIWRKTSDGTHFPGYLGNGFHPFILDQEGDISNHVEWDIADRESLSWVSPGDKLIFAP